MQTQADNLQKNNQKNNRLTLKSHQVHRSKKNPGNEKTDHRKKKKKKKVKNIKTKKKKKNSRKKKKNSSIQNSFDDEPTKNSFEKKTSFFSRIVLPSTGLNITMMTSQLSRPFLAHRSKSASIIIFEDFITNSSSSTKSFTKKNIADVIEPITKSSKQTHFQNTETISKNSSYSSNSSNDSETIQRKLQQKQNKNKNRIQELRPETIETESFVDQKNTSNDSSDSSSSKRDTAKKKFKRFKKLTLKDFITKNRKNLKKSIKTKLKKKIKMKIASPKNEKPIIVKIKNEKLKTEYIIRYLHLYAKFIVDENAENVNLTAIPNKSNKPKTDANTVKI